MKVTGRLKLVSDTEHESSLEKFCENIQVQRIMIALIVRDTVMRTPVTILELLANWFAIMVSVNIGSLVCELT